MTIQGPTDARSLTSPELVATQGLRLRWSRWLRWEVNTRAGRWTTGRLAEDPTILVAGCSVTRALEFARSFPAGRVVSVQVTEEDARTTETLARGLPTNNVVLERRDPSLLADIDGRFDLVAASRALNRVEDPAALLRALVSRLNPGGILALSFQSGRREALVQDFRTLVGLLAAASPDLSQQALGEALTQGFDFTDTRLFATVDQARDLYTADHRAWAERFVRSSARSYGLDEMFEVMQSANVRFLGWMEPARWHLGPRLLDATVAAAFDAMPARDRWRFMDRVLAPGFHLYAGRAEDPEPAAPWLEDDQLLLDSPIHATEWMESGPFEPTGRVHKAFALRAAPGSEDEVVLETPARSEYTLHVFFDSLLKALDGERTLRQAIERTAVDYGLDIDSACRKVVPTVRRLLHPHGVLLVGPTP